MHCVIRDLCLWSRMTLPKGPNLLKIFFSLPAGQKNSLCSSELCLGYKKNPRHTVLECAMCERSEIVLVICDSRGQMARKAGL